MEVTRHNFNEELDSILQAIDESTFIAFDTEFTGLSTGQGNQPAPFDTPAQRYDKLRKGASDFLLLQVGICTFKADPESQRYEARPYNFYVFPRPFGRQSPDRRFLCQSSSIDFLLSHNFDFNKVFKEGIPFLTQVQEQKMKADLEQKHTDLNNQSFSSMFSPDGGVKKNTPVSIPDEYKSFIDEICEKVKNYVNGEDDEPLSLPACNAFVRKLIYQAVEAKCPQTHLETKTGEKKERYIEVKKAKDADELQQLNLDKQMIERMELDMQLGFTKVMRAISESGKLLIGHNMFLDVIHSVSHFFGPLPQGAEKMLEDSDLLGGIHHVQCHSDDFKAMVHSVFPRLLDTKLMANTNPFKEYFMSSSLEEVCCTVQHPPFKPAKVNFVEGFEKYKDSNVFHEAGYDAYITGFCFASMVNFFGAYQTPPTAFMLPSQTCIEPFINKPTLMRIADIPYLNLTGADVEGNRDHVFHVTFPVEWKSNDLYQLFEPYGNIQISWLTERTAYVGLLKKDNAKLAFNEGKMAMESKATTTPEQRLNTGHPVAGFKRKSPNTDLAFPVIKKERRSITKDITPQSPIPEVEEISDTGTSPSLEKKIKKANNKETACELKKELAPPPEKLFEESDQW